MSKFFSRKYLMDTLSREAFDAEKFHTELEQNYDILAKQYRNEFFFKNTLFNKLVLGKYSLNTTSAFSEMIVGKSKADFVLINGNKSKVYEIKTDLDNLERLVNQVEDYSRAFSEIYVVTSEKNYYPVYKVIKELNPSIGIIVLTDRIHLSVRKQALENDTNLEHEVLFKLLRKKEYEEILLLKFGLLPDVKPVQYFKACLYWFKKLDVKEAQNLVLQQLKKRIVIEDDKVLKGLPEQIRWLIYTGNFKHKELVAIYDRVKQN
ncbi:sce7726 family protein [Bacillus thuringiensis]|uniref:sce7726 family protein n=1 Tax=Bacillus thuringiensis TaxID=1428 RepID=UPI001A8EB5CC|nr:sce7726 family protein [Bacillus thuringiensis]